jgi:hypothetical protein
VKKRKAKEKRETAAMMVRAMKRARKSHIKALRACLGLWPIEFMTNPEPHTMGCTCGACSNRFGRRSTSEEA